MEKLLNSLSSEFQGFGPSILAPFSRGNLVRRLIPEEREDARTLLHDDCPMTPGVYGWLDNNHQICYVGKSKALRKRLLSYFAKTPADPKADRIRRHSSQIVWEPVSDELLALIREQELIHRWRPDFNTQGQPTRRQPAFIGISAGTAPHAFFTRQLSEKAKWLFGPIAGTGQLRTAVESLNQAFRLRDCPDNTKFQFNNQSRLFDDVATAKCIRHELGSCTAPCAGLCSRTSYLQQVDEAVSFLQGNNRQIFQKLEHEMTVAAAELRFERAATLRNHLSNLKWLDRRLASLRSAKTNLNGVLPLPSIRQSNRRHRKLWLILKAGRLVASVMEPVRPEQAIRVADVLRQSAACQIDLPSSILDTHFKLLVTSWFRRNARQKEDLMPFDLAAEQCSRVAQGRRAA